MADKLSDLEHIRKRPGMYIGGTKLQGLHHLPGELIGNSIDEFLRGRATRVAVSVNDGVVTVTDDGSGLPFDQPSTQDADSLVCDYFTNFHRTPSVDSHAPHVHFHSPMGVGLVVVNALSEFMTVESWTDGKLYRQAYSRGAPTSSAEQSEGSDVEPFFPNADGSKRGTRITYKADPEIFGERLTDGSYLRSRMFDAAHLHPGIVIELQNERFHAPGGLGDLVRFNSFSPTSGCFVLNTVHDEIAIHAAASGKQPKRFDEFAQANETQWTTWANGVQTAYSKTSGTHQDAFDEALKSVGWQPRIAMIHVVMHEPKYAGPTKTKLDVPEKKQAMIDALTTALEKYCEASSLGRFAAN